MAGRGSPEWRLRVIEEAQLFGNVRAICERENLDRTTFYKLKRRIQGLPRDEQLKALEDQPRRWKSHKQQTTPKERRAIRSLALKHPSWGCNPLQQQLLDKGIKRSAGTVQKIMSDEGLGTERDRWLALDTEDAQLSSEQLGFVKQFNPRLKSKRESHPGAKIDLGWFPIGPIPNLGQLVMIAAVDRASSLAFGTVRRTASEAAMIWLIEKRITVGLKELAVKARAVVIPRKPVLGNRFNDALKECDIKRIDRKHGQGPAGGIEAFRRAVVTGFVAQHARNEIYDDAVALRNLFRTWLAEYNSTVLDGFPNYGLSPLEKLKAARPAR